MAQISNEYAEALFALALETGSVKEYSEALDIVLNLMKENPEYIDFLSSPDIPKQERVGALESAFGGKIPETVVSFLCLEKDKLSTFVKAGEYNCSYSAQAYQDGELKGEVTGVVTVIVG